MNFINLYVFFCLFFFSRGSWKKDCMRVLVICLGDLKKKLQMVHCTALFIFVKWHKVQFRWKVIKNFKPTLVWLKWLHGFMVCVWKIVLFLGPFDQRGRVIAAFLHSCIDAKLCCSYWNERRRRNVCKSLLVVTPRTLTTAPRFRSQGQRDTTHKFIWLFAKKFPTLCSFISVWPPLTSGGRHPPFGTGW